MQWRAFFFVLVSSFLCAAADAPDSSLNLKLQAPIKTWDEAVPLGNGAMGVLLWGESNQLRLSLDCGDLWDERPSKAFLKVKDRFNYATLKGLVASNNMGEFNEIFDANYDCDSSPTKLPAGRVEITLDPGQSVEAFELNLAAAEGMARLKGGGEARIFVNAADVANPVALALIPGPALKDVQLGTPESVGKLGYLPARQGRCGDMRWFEQEAANGFAYAVCVGWKRAGDATLLAVAVATRREGANPLGVAQARVLAGLKKGYKRLRAGHVKWWTNFWKHSQVTLPDARILRQYYLDRYFYGAASRRGAPPMPLQGVWSADAGSLPPWKGDYHNDLNTQMTYIAYRASGDFDEGACYLDFLWKLLPAFRKFARDFYDAPGAAVPGVMSLAGQPLGGWAQYSLSPTMGAWTAHLFYLHWRATGDDAFLRERAYPFCREIGVCLRALLKPDTNGILKLPLSSSPEIFDNTRQAFLKPNSNFDLACMKMLFLALEEMAGARGDAPAAAEWAATARQLGDFHTAPDGTLLLDETTPLPRSHRHLSNLIGIYPFNLITIDDGEQQRQIIAASLKDWDQKGTSQWCGYSFAWMACLRARVGDAEAALRNLDIFTRAFVLRNGFHANGDQTQSGFSGFTYRPFTLEGNFLAMQAVHEMLLQSWSAGPGSGDVGAIRLFPAMPERWHEASFNGLRAEGGHRVSAKRANNVTTWFRIVAGRNGLIRIRDNFGGGIPQWSRTGVKKVGDNFEVTLKSGQSVEATLPKALGAAAGRMNLNRSFKLRAGTESVRFNPLKDADLRRLQSQVEKWLRRPGDGSKHTRRGLEEIGRLTEAALAGPSAPERERLESDLVETALAVNNIERPTIPRRFDVILAPVALRQLSRPIGVGQKPADNLQPGPSDDLSRRDPLPSSFWSPPADIAGEDLSNGFGRQGLPPIATKLCHYSAAKETAGMNPGFEVNCDGDIVKLKFGEVSSEPLVTRMFWALGFHADPTDHAPGVKVAYDRRIFTEFNSRQPVRTTFTVLWIIPVGSMNLQRFKDPFDYVAAAVLRDGRQWSGPELRRHLMAGTNFQPTVEAQIDYIVTTPANVQVKDPQVKSIGPWDYGQLDHADRREVRGAGLLAAWLGFYDTRFDNTKLRLVGPKKHPRLEHYFSDLGGGLGRTTGLLSWHGEDVNAFPWSFTAPPLPEGKGRRAMPLRIVGYTPIVPTPAFAAMTIDDARWMARLIGQLRTGQITQALAASGYDAASVRLYTQKLISRRNKMMADLGLSAEFPPLGVE